MKSCEIEKAFSSEWRSDKGGEGGMKGPAHARTSSQLAVMAPPGAPLVVHLVAPLVAPRGGLLALLCLLLVLLGGAGGTGAVPRSVNVFGGERSNNVQKKPNKQAV